MRRFSISAAIAVGCILAIPPCVAHGQVVPKSVGPYVTVYRPVGDRFAGPDTLELKAGAFYSDWVPNDHAIIRGPDDRWHAFGITHPLTSAENIHDGEFQSFHARAPRGKLSDVLRDGTWTDLPKVLSPAQRPGEILENHAPSILQRNHEYVMIYGPSPIRWASSDDLEIWKPRGVLFEESGSTRDPSVLLWQGTYYMIVGLYAESRGAMEAILATPEGQAAVADVPNFATGGATFMYDYEEVLILYRLS